MLAEARMERHGRAVVSNHGGQHPKASGPRSESLRLLFVLRPLKRLLQILPRLFQSSEGVVVRLDRLPVLIDGALALAGDVENLPQLDMAPNLRPPRISVAVDRRTVRVCRRLIVSLQEENL